VICPNCGESNSSNFRYCGMCGTSLEVRKPVGAPRVANSQEISRPSLSVPAETRTPVETRVPIGSRASQVDVEDRVPANGGPSFLGLNDSFTDPNVPERSSLQDQSFSGTSSFYEPEEGNIGARRVILLLLLLAVLGGAAWWAYSNYNKTGAGGRHIPLTPSTQPENAENSADNSTTAKVPNGGPSTDTNGAKTESPAAPSQSPAPAGNAMPDQAKADQAKADQAKTDQAKPDQANKEANAPESASSTTPPAAQAERPSSPSRAAHTQRTSARPSRSAPRPSPAVAASDDKGAAEFRKGEAYLYGRGAATNCSEAIKNLKAASAKQNAKARSTFGTMYATGHCVARDLPTSYTWFALALQADPNNQILEKDLVAVWNQMTPPERQMATRSKQASQ
jgi:hypothetical protein